jgi:Flp pilus assembly pilin Flp
MISRFIQDESRTTFVEYALIAALVAAIVVLRVTMQA